MLANGFCRARLPIIKGWIVSDADVTGCARLVEPRQHRGISRSRARAGGTTAPENLPAVATFDSLYQARFGSDIRELACRIFSNADCRNHAEAEAVN
ncbi:hypothetical protein ABIE78_000405 [Sinorhizobium fredii]|uniref:Uncharacterized protein n=1 Tax=Sinorhizobium fredii (strain USDA 257) TaxID=1185652 RepID=I3XHE7_SINF2|nr:hypothetical protein USDA257_p05880 [Sinorhizobium fredii USDA 257]